MDKNKSKNKLKLSSSSTSRKITNFFKSVEQFELKSNSGDVPSSAKNELRPNGICKENSVKDVKVKSPGKEEGHSNIKEEKSVNKCKIKDEKPVKKNKEQKKHRINEKNAVNNPDHLKTNTSEVKNVKNESCGNSKMEEKCTKSTPDKTVKNKEDCLKSDQNTGMLKFLNKSPSILSQGNLDNEVQMKNKTKDKISKRKLNNDGEFNLKYKFNKAVSDVPRKSLVLFNFLNIQQGSVKSEVKVNEAKSAVKSIKSSSKSSKGDNNKTRVNKSAGLKDESSNHERLSNKTCEVDVGRNKISKKHIVNKPKSAILKSPEKNDKKKSIGVKHRKADSAGKCSIEKDPKPDLRECEDIESKNHKRNVKKRKRSDSIQSGEEVHKKSKSLNNSSILRYMSPSKQFHKSKCKIESDEQEDCESAGEKPKKLVKKVSRNKIKFHTMTKSVNGLDGWLCSSKAKQIRNKYGIKVPSYMNIMKNVQRRKLYSEQLKEACKIIDSHRSEEAFVEEIEDDDIHSNMLTCTDLSLEKMEEYFAYFKEDCLDIINGRVCHDRHEKYMNRAKKDMITMSFLVYNVSTVVFSVDQKKTLANLCEKYFDDCDIYKPTQYYFKVLIPELCLKIFMDVHGMDKDSALHYLENMPVPED